MTKKTRLQTKPATPKPTISLSRPSILQRTCACGGVPGLTEECEACSRQRLSRSPGATNPSTLGDRAANDHATDQSQQSPLSGYSFGKLAIAPKERLGIQTKLAIGRSGDQYEQEADQVSDQVMRMPAPEQELQRQSKKPEEDEQKKKRLQMQPLQRQAEPSVAEEDEKKKKQLQMKSMSAAESEASPDLQERISGLQQSGGQPLSTSERAFFEPRFRQDFSQVRLHTDTQTADLAQAVNARAFTVGRDVVFGAGQYQPRSSEGQRLLAHELTHVVQQGKEIRRYRSTGAFNFGKQDDATLIEDSFNVKKDKETKPWIKQITVEFDSVKADSDGNTYSSGTASVQYYDNPVKLPDFSFPVSGGSQTLGKTGSGTFTVWRIEGIGYNSGTASGQPGVDYDLAEREGPNKRYSKDLAANMSYAVFYNKGEALHAGPLDFSSHGCVHVDWTDYATIKQLNYHSVIGLTKVKVKYLSKKEIEERQIAEQVKRERLRGADEYRAGGHGVPAP